MAATFAGIKVTGTIRLNTGSVPTPTDQYSQYTVLRLPGTGTNNAANNTFIDSSTNNFTVTRFGNTTQGSFSPFSTAPGYWSNYFDGSGDWITVPNNSAFNFETQDFTVEAWVYQINSKQTTIIGKWGGGASQNTSFIFRVENTGKLGLAYNNGTTELNATASTLLINYNQWTHVAWVKSGTTLRYYINGVQDATSNTISNFKNSTADVLIGLYNTLVDTYFNGYISNLRVVKGTALYTTNFTPSTTPLTAVTNTSLLTCQSNRFIDNSTNNFTITRNGDTSISSFGPFAPASSYNSATMGGSMYFDGTGDYLTIPDSATLELGSNNFTVEAWIYPTSLSGARAILGKWLPSAYAFMFYTFGTELRLGINNSLYVFSSANAITTNQWQHVAVVRNGNTFTLYVNGSQVATTNSSISVNNDTTAWHVGINPDTLAFPWIGYISNLRLMNGTAVYTANFTPSTAPVSAISGTSLLLNGTNAAIYDASTKNVLETAGDAKVSTTVSTNGSMYFDGNGDYLLAPSNDTQQLGAGNFTIEMWMRSSSSGVLLTKDNNEFVNYGNLLLKVGPTVYFHCNPNPNSETGRVVLTSTSTVTTNNWVHIAVSRTGNSWYLFVNGILESTASSSVGFWNTSSPFYVGCALLRSSPAGFYQGYINDLRITKGIARYTANFTPPTRS